MQINYVDIHDIWSHEKYSTIEHFIKCCRDIRWCGNSFAADNCWSYLYEQELKEFYKNSQNITILRFIEGDFIEWYVSIKTHNEVVNKLSRMLKLKAFI